jgi:hypothetical protein
MRIGVTSDLHMLSLRSTFPRYAQELQRAISESQVFVWNGDIFDFRWSTKRTLSESISAAIFFLRQQLECHPHCTMHYVLGNHDCHPAFVAALHELSHAQPKLKVHLSHLRIGSSIFLHGDAVHCPQGLAELEIYRTRFHENHSRSYLLGAAYSLVSASRVQRLTSLLHTKQKLARNILQYLEHELGAELQLIKSIYFGHTHLQNPGFNFQGRGFYNSGGMLRGVRHRLFLLNSSEECAPS